LLLSFRHGVIQSHGFFIFWPDLRYLSAAL
jgi:hypothetical protein